MSVCTFILIFDDLHFTIFRLLRTGSNCLLNPNWGKMQRGFSIALQSPSANPHWELDFIEYLLIPTGKTEEASERLQQLSKSDLVFGEDLQVRLKRLLSKLISTK